MQIALLDSAKSQINITYRIKILMNGFKFWNAVSNGRQIVLLKYFLVVSNQWFVWNLLKHVHAVWFVEKFQPPWTIKLLKVDPDLDISINIL